jgi:hypothetical protein
MMHVASFLALSNPLFSGATSQWTGVRGAFDPGKLVTYV